MKLHDYIKGDRRGPEAHRTEFDAMTDPFLCEALEGYDATEGDHAAAIDRMQCAVQDKAAPKPRMKVLYWTASAVALLGITAFGFYLFSPAYRGKIAMSERIDGSPLVAQVRKQADNKAGKAPEAGSPSGRTTPEEQEISVGLGTEAMPDPAVNRETDTRAFAAAAAGSVRDEAKPEPEAALRQGAGNDRSAVQQREVSASAAAAPAAEKYAAAGKVELTGSANESGKRVETPAEKPAGATAKPAPVETSPSQPAAMPTAKPVEASLPQPAGASPTGRETPRSSQPAAVSTAKPAETPPPQPAAASPTGRETLRSSQPAAVSAARSAPAETSLSQPAAMPAAKPAEASPSSQPATAPTAGPEPSHPSQPTSGAQPSRPISAQSITPSLPDHTRDAFTAFVSAKQLRLLAPVQGTVVVSFSVNRRGRPQSVRIEKSLSAEADQEVKRLLYNGPDWPDVEEPITITFRFR